jgi:hypothetical protein
MDYINNTWINDSTWKPASWTVLLPVSEDKQRRCRLAPPDQQESTETKLVDVHSHRTTAQGSQITTDSTQAVTEGKLRRYQRKKTKELQHRIFTLCDKYSEEEVTVNQLLKKCGKIYGGQ